MTMAQFAEAGKMTIVEYRKRREAIRATYGDTAAERTGLFDQELARLYRTSRWTHGELAKEEGKGEKWIERHVRLGHFLENVPWDVSLKSLTESLDGSPQFPGITMRRIPVWRRRLRHLYQPIR